MRCLRSGLVLLSQVVLTACPSKPPQAELIEVDGPIDAPSESPDTMLPDTMLPIDGPNVIELGFPTPLPGTRTVDGDDFVGFPIRVAAGQAGELMGWGVQSVSGPPGTQIRMALYSHVAATNQPATLVAQSGAWNLTSSVQPASGFLLNAGDYWLLVSVSNTISIGRSSASPAESREW